MSKAELVKARYDWADVIACRDWPESDADGATVVMTDYGQPDKWMIANVDHEGRLIDSEDELSREEALTRFENGEEP